MKPTQTPKHLYPKLLSYEINVALGIPHSIAIMVWKNEKNETCHHFYKVHVK
jgi:hypothetical protein